MDPSKDADAARHCKRTVVDDLKALGLGPDVMPPWTRAASTAFTQYNAGGWAPSTLRLLNYSALSNKAAPLEVAVKAANNEKNADDKAPKYGCNGTADKILFSSSKGPDREVALHSGVRNLYFHGQLPAGPKTTKQPYPQPPVRKAPAGNATSGTAAGTASGAASGTASSIQQQQPMYCYVMPRMYYAMPPAVPPQPAHPQQQQHQQQQPQYYYAGAHPPPASAFKEVHHVHHHYGDRVYSTSIPNAVSAFDERTRLYHQH